MIVVSSLIFFFFCSILNSNFKIKIELFHIMCKQFWFCFFKWVVLFKIHFTVNYWPLLFFFYTQSIYLYRLFPTDFYLFIFYEIVCRRFIFRWRVLIFLCAKLIIFTIFFKYLQWTIKVIEREIKIGKQLSAFYGFI